MDWSKDFWLYWCFPLTFHSTPWPHSAHAFPHCQIPPAQHRLKKLQDFSPHTVMIRNGTITQYDLLRYTWSNYTNYTLISNHNDSYDTVYMLAVWTMKHWSNSFSIYKSWEALSPIWLLKCYDSPTPLLLMVTQTKLSRKTCSLEIFKLQQWQDLILLFEDWLHSLSAIRNYPPAVNYKHETVRTYSTLGLTHTNISYHTELQLFGPNHLA